jgi:hypothetical protein
MYVIILTFSVHLLLNVLHRQIVYVCWLAFELVFLYFTILETKYLSLEETAALFDGDSAIEQITGKTHEIGDKPADVREDVDEKGSSGSYHGAELKA